MKMSFKIQTTALEKDTDCRRQYRYHYKFQSSYRRYHSGIDAIKRIEVYTSNDPVVVLSEFKQNFYDLLLVDINMPHMNGFQLCEKILAIDINVRICFMSSGEIKLVTRRF